MSLESQTLNLVMNREQERFRGSLDQLKEELREKAPVKTGATRDSIQVLGGGLRHADGSLGGTSSRASQLKAEVFASTLQAKLTNQGTGLSGPKGAYITPKVAKVLHWIDGSGDVFAMRSAGSGAHKGWFTKTVARWPELLRLQ